LVGKGDPKEQSNSAESRACNSAKRLARFQEGRPARRRGVCAA
jgi:hypothetical protein